MHEYARIPDGVVMQPLLLGRDELRGDRVERQVELDLRGIATEALNQPGAIKGHPSFALRGRAKDGCPFIRFSLIPPRAQRRVSPDAKVQPPGLAAETKLYQKPRWPAQSAVAPCSAAGRRRSWTWMSPVSFGHPQ